MLHGREGWGWCMPQAHLLLLWGGGGVGDIVIFRLEQKKTLW